MLHNFFVFEGIDGSGTSTQMKLLKEKLNGKPVHFTAEPTDLATGRFLRSVLKGEITVQPSTIARLFAADRNEHVFAPDGILSYINNGKIVVQDRYIFSNFAYQSAFCGKELIYELNKDFPLPQTVFYFDIDPSVSINRIQGRAVTEIYEKIDILTKTREAYREILSEYKDKTNVVYIDATEPIETIHQKVLGIVSQNLV